MTALVERMRLTLDRDGSTLLADLSDFGLPAGAPWPDAVTVRYGGAAENVFTRVGFNYANGEITSARYGNRIGQRLIIFND